MAEQTKKRKLATSAIALTTAAALLLGGTLAWQSISQEATNIVSAAVNPGGRLHDDFDGSNDKNVYVENFGNQNIYARIKLSEYLEIGQNAGTFADGTDRDDVDVLLGTDVDDRTTYETYLYGGDNISDSYWTKDWEGSTKYIPTFNKNQDSLEADLNGTYEYVDGDGNSVPYGDFVDINDMTVGDEVTGDEIVDADTNDIDEGAEAAEDVNITTTTGVAHQVKESIDGTVISMADWDGTAGDYWVYDADGWAYWANPIAPGEATGLLLDSITDLGYIDEDYYYAIHVTGQFITAGDLGDTDSTGFYQNAGEEPSAEALELLKTIGVKVGEDDGTGEGGEGGNDPVMPAEANLILVNDAAEEDKEIVLFAGNSVTLSLVDTLNGSGVTDGSIGMMQEYDGVTLTDNEDGTYTLAADDTVTVGTVVELAASAMVDGAAVMDQLTVTVDKAEPAIVLNGTEYHAGNTEVVELTSNSTTLEIVNIDNPESTVWTATDPTMFIGYDPLTPAPITGQTVKLGYIGTANQYTITATYEGGSISITVEDKITNQ